ncbi:MAG TPA: hypothetical protein VJ910_10095 [Desulfuromonadales bacterium]|nr:hypothetical protein [Desulfuromonadales bacterium]
MRKTLLKNHYARHLVSTIGLVLLLAATAMAKDPKVQPDDAWISISGEVQSVTADTFMLDYGAGDLIVEMDDGDRDADAYQLLPGDKVTVTGRIDDDFFEQTTLEASSVYVEKIGTFFFASPADEEEPLFALGPPVTVAESAVRGMVTVVEDQEFQLDTGLKSLSVNVEKMPYNPLDDVGYQKIRPGDIVRVTGNIDVNLFTRNEIVADTVTKLVD